MLGRSLCIIDEFGKGTLTSDGIGLLCATLQQFSKGTPPPKVIACTHFSEVCNDTYLARYVFPSLLASGKQMKALASFWISLLGHVERLALILGKQLVSEGTGRNGDSH